METGILRQARGVAEKNDDDTFAWGYEYLVIGPSAFVTE